MKRITQLAALSLFFFATVSLAEVVAIPGTSVSLNAPEGFTVSRSFSGLENVEDGSSITVAELPLEAFEQVNGIFSSLESARAGFRQQGVEIESLTTVKVGDSKIPVLIGEQKSPVGNIGKYMALYKHGSTTLLTFNIFNTSTLTPSVVEETISSVRLAAKLTMDEKLEQLPFTFAVKKPFRIGDTLMGSTVLLTTFDGTDPSGTKPAVIITKSLQPVTANIDLNSFSKQLLNSTQGFEQATVKRQEDVTFAGGQGVYSEATLGERKVIQYLSVPADSYYIRMVGYGNTVEIDKLLSVLSEIASSLEIR